jgi:hypothetical protein
MGMSNITSTPVCTVSTRTVRYHTIGSAGEDAEASTALMLPSGSDPACSGPRPVLLYAPGTSPLKSYDMSKLDGTEARMIAAIFAAQGFIVVAPNYAGDADPIVPYYNTNAAAGYFGVQNMAAVRDAYHAGLAVPFCLRAARDFFRAR